MPTGSLSAMELRLDPHDVTLLRELLDSALRDLRMEITQTDNHRWKKDLHAREDRIRALLEPFGGPLPAQA